MSTQFSLIVTDASPLITLAVAGALDTLTMLEVPIIVPDMVYFEVSRHLDKPGAKELMDWILDKQGPGLSIAATEVFEEFSILERAKPGIKSKNRGEQAAAEVLNRQLSKGSGAILLFEDSDLKKVAFTTQMPPNVLMLSTSAYLDGLEQRKLIPSANAILRAATDVRGNMILNRIIQDTSEDQNLEPQWRGIRPSS